MCEVVDDKSLCTAACYGWARDTNTKWNNQHCDYNARGGRCQRWTHEIGDEEQQVNAWRSYIVRNFVSNSIHTSPPPSANLQRKFVQITLTSAFDADAILCDWSIIALLLTNTSYSSISGMFCCSKHDST